MYNARATDTVKAKQPVEALTLNCHFEIASCLLTYGVADIRARKEERVGKNISIKKKIVNILESRTDSLAVSSSNEHLHRSSSIRKLLPLRLKLLKIHEKKKK